MVCQLPPDLRPAARGTLFSPGELGRARCRPGRAARRADGHRRRVWRPDESELSARRNRQHQSDTGHVWPLPLLLLARLRLDWPGSLAAARIGIAVEAGRAVSTVAGRTSATPTADCMIRLTSRRVLQMAVTYHRRLAWSC